MKEKKLKSFYEFTKEFRWKFDNSWNQYKIQILSRSTGLSNKKDFFILRLMNFLYENYIHLIVITGNKSYNKNPKIPSYIQNNYLLEEIPVLNFSSNHHILLDKAKKVFNKVEDFLISTSKSKFHKEFSEYPFICKTVYRIEDIEELQLPIIAKPDNSSSSKGIEVFNTYEDARKSTNIFSLWSEKKEIQKEFRAFVMADEIIHIYERVKNVKNNKNIETKSLNESIDFVYIDQILEDFPYKKELLELKSIFSEKVYLDFYSIDIMIDKDNRIWVPEINAAPGILPSLAYPLYKKWLKIAFDISISPKAEHDLKLISKIYRDMIKTYYYIEYNNSINPI